MFSNDVLHDHEEDEKDRCTSTIDPLGRAKLLKGHPLISNISTWCRRHSKRRNGVKPTLAVVYFDTGEDAQEYLYVKAVVAARAGIEYTTHKLRPEASLDCVVNLISSLNRRNSAHGILIQRPIPSHLSERKVMNSISPAKHIEEFTHGKPENIALAALERLLSFYNKSRLLEFNTILLGGTNIITEAFIEQLALRHGKSKALSHPPEDLSYCAKNTIVITELNHDSAITPDTLGPRVMLVVDLGFDVETKQGDLDPEVLDMEGLMVVPTPGGVLPVLLWMMMERTIRARDRIGGGVEKGAPGCCIVL